MEPMHLAPRSPAAATRRHQPRFTSRHTERAHPASDGPTRRHQQFRLVQAWWCRSGGRAAQVVLLGLVVFVLGVRVASGALVPHGPGISGVAGPESVTVAPGDTWWSVASELFPEHDPRQAVDQLMSRRSQRPLMAGETILRASVANPSATPQVAVGTEPMVDGGTR